MDDDDRDDRRSGSLRLERGRRQPNPNIVYIISDDQGWKDVGYHGSDIKTTNIDTLAQGGARLDQFYAQPMCTPSAGRKRPSSQYPFNSGVFATASAAARSSSAAGSKRSGGARSRFSRSSRAKAAVTSTVWDR